MSPRRKGLFALLIALSLALPHAVSAQGTVNASCSSQIAEAFGRTVLDDFKQTTGLNVTLHVFSSQVSVNRLKNGFCELAASALKLSADDRKLGLVAIPICKDPMVVIACKEITVSDLSLTQVRRLFSGHITNWKEAGGPDLPVRIITPVKETAAYVNFVRQAMGASQVKFDYQAARSSSAVEAVSHIPGAISFATRSVVTKFNNVKMFTIDGLEPGSKEYPYMQTFSLVTRGQPSGVVREVLNYSLSKKARENMKRRGLTPLID
ncbi:substrate-binding domain-containing protein [Desulfoluna spongiiphila]|uniref:substrate-binding domain-containing protein n=1 Tax=Desulfoluna spongiiphila TaxID=419481 RepID=UPI0012545976|nr:substrate-binding domain-containing protein [Desulfoluna spongiiphila]VVS93273.1 pbp domain [Desulfoluna spongiiphila]